MAWRDLLEVLKDAVFRDDPALLENRRKQPRIAMQLPVTGKSQSGVFQGELLDLGMSGLRLGLPIRLKKDEEVTVHASAADGLSGESELKCKVVWCKKTNDNRIQAGLLYNDSRERLAKSWVHYLLLQNQVSVGERKDRRIDASLPVLIEDLSGNPLAKGNLVDLSLGGAKVRLTESVPQDKHFWLSISVGGDSTRSVRMEAMVVAVSKPAAGDSLEDLMDLEKLQNLGTFYDYGLRFLPNEGQGRALRRLIYAILKDLRKTKKPRKSNLNGAKPSVKLITPRRLEGALGDAVVETSADSDSESSDTVTAPIPKKAKLQTSKFLTSARAAQPVELSDWKPLPKWDSPNESDPEPPTQHWKKRAKHRSYSRSILEGYVADQFPGIEDIRGWFQAAYQNEFRLHSWMPDQIARPSSEFFEIIPHLQLAGPLSCGWLPMCLGGYHVVGPGLIWADRTAYGALMASIRKPAAWLSHLVKTKERIERRPLTLQERFMLLLSILSLGGPGSSRSLLICAQISLNIAREAGLEDQWDLNDLIMGSALKDIGEVLWLVATAQKYQRERWAVQLNGQDLDCPRIESLLQRWPEFRLPSNLIINRYSPPPELLEVLPLHPQLGHEVLTELGFPGSVVKIALHHHEAFNGSGYPDGLAGQDIPWMARCVAVADAFAGLVIEENLPAEAFGKIERASGLLFDPEIVESLRAYLSGLGLC
jgi:hypothetical protein